MRTSSNWFKAIGRKFAKKSIPRDIIVVHSNNTASNSEEETIAIDDDQETANLLHDTVATQHRVVLTHEDIAAMKIQAHFRRHLARRAFRALRSLVKLQAMVRGARVRKQARIALDCMHAMVRLQVSVRARQLLGRISDNDHRLALQGRLC